MKFNVNAQQYNRKINLSISTNSALPVHFLITKEGADMKHELKFPLSGQAKDREVLGLHPHTKIVYPVQKKKLLKKGGVAMKKIVMIMVAVGLVCLGASYAQAQNSAVIIKDIGCVTSQCSGISLFTDETITVVTSSGNVILTCQFDIPEGFEPAKAIVTEGFECGIYTPDGNVITTDSKAVCSPGGKVTLKCMYKPEK
jgi:hypothetical protein